MVLQTRSLGDGDIGIAHLLHLRLGEFRADAQFVDQSQAMAAVLPPDRGRHLVTADMDVLRGEYVHDLVQDVLDESVFRILAQAQDIRRRSGRGRYGIPGAHAAQFRIRSQGGDSMSRNVEFRHHGNAALRRVPDDLLQLFLGIEAIVPAIARIGGRCHPIGADGNQLRVFGHGNPPSLVVGQDEMEAVHLVHRHEVQVLLDLVDREEMAADIQEETPIAETRFIGNIHGRNRPGIGHGRSSVYGGRHELFQRLDGVEQPRPRGGLDHHLVSCNCQCISLFSQGPILQEIEPGGLPRPGRNALFDSQAGRERIDNIDTRIPEGGIEVDAGTEDRETAFAGRERHGIRDQVERLSRLVTT